MVQNVCKCLIFSLHFCYSLLSVASYCKHVGCIPYSHPDLITTLSELIYFKCKLEHCINMLNGTYLCAIDAFQRSSGLFLCLTQGCLLPQYHAQQKAVVEAGGWHSHLMLPWPISGAYQTCFWSHCCSAVSLSFPCLTEEYLMQQRCS